MNHNHAMNRQSEIAELKRELDAILDAVNASGTAIGNETTRYTTAERIRDITAQRDYFMRECDKARKAIPIA